MVNIANPEEMAIMLKLLQKLTKILNTYPRIISAGEFAAKHKTVVELGTEITKQLINLTMLLEHGPKVVEGIKKFKYIFDKLRIKDILNFFLFHQR